MIVEASCMKHQSKVSERNVLQINFVNVAFRKGALGVIEEGAMTSCNVIRQAEAVSCSINSKTGQARDRAA